jgi:hypothetical protein
MRRGELTRIAVILVIGTCLVLWLVYATRPEAQVHALEVHHAKPILSPVDVSANESATEKFTEETAAPSASNDPPQDIVPGSGHSVRHIPIENVPGPEPLPGLTPATVLQNMRGTIRDYSARFGGNPFGNNREITAKLNGGNAKQIVFLKEEDGMRINERGELIDNWGTPFFFHQISGTEMEIHSAGPDRKMWTADDLVLK